MEFDTKLVLLLRFLIYEFISRLYFFIRCYAGQIKFAVESNVKFYKQLAKVSLKIKLKLNLRMNYIRWSAT